MLFLYGTPSAYPNYIDVVRRCGGEVLASLNPADARGCTGLLLPGGGDLNPALYGQPDLGSHPPDKKRDAAELALCRDFLAQGRPILGICRGLQALNVALGGTLVQDLPNHSQVDGADRLHPVHAERGSPPERLYGSDFTVNSAHHQAADSLGTGLRAVCRAEDGTVEALFHEALPVLGVQWHPERLTGRLRRAAAVDGGALFAWFLSELCR